MRASIVVALLLGCGPSSTVSSPAAPRPVRVQAEAEAPVARPVRVEPTLAGETHESPDLASPPPVEAPTGP
jgi:hypothetical protein